MQLYLSFIEEKIKFIYNSLTEKDKRLYAAIEAVKIGYGGISYISQIVDCSRATVKRGIKELENQDIVNDLKDRIRQPGGGRKPYYEIYDNIDEQFLDVLKHYTAGDPMDANVIWTDLTPTEIIQKMKEKYDLVVSETVIYKLLKKHNYRLRKIIKSKTEKNVENRNEQFENIEEKINEYMPSENPIVSMDTKKKEYLGNLYRDGKLYCQKAIEANDHDFISTSDGVIIPHGIYDYKLNIGYIHIGISKDTSEFACDSIRNWWYNYGKYNYPNANSILILCDGGGSNSSRNYIFKYDLQNLAEEFGLEIRIAHYPPYTSKYNPIEHRLFPHVTRACQGVIFSSIEIVQELIKKTKTSTGLKAFVKIFDKIYETGRKVNDDFKENMNIVFDDYLPKWNYRAIPVAKLKVEQLI